VSIHSLKTGISRGLTVTMSTSGGGGGGGFDFLHATRAADNESRRKAKQAAPFILKGPHFPTHASVFIRELLGQNNFKGY